MRKVTCLLLAILLTVGAVFADTSSLNLAVPSVAPNFQSDRIRAGELECDMAIGSSTNVEFGVVGILNGGNPYGTGLSNNVAVNPNMDTNQFVRDVGVYARITIPIGAPKQRLNCNILYELELEKKRLEVFKLKQEIERLRNLKFEN